MYYKLLYRERTALPPPGAERDHARAHAANSGEERNPSSRENPQPWNRDTTHRPCPPAVLAPTGAVLMGNSSYTEVTG